MAPCREPASGPSCGHSPCWVPHVCVPGGHRRLRAHPPGAQDPRRGLECPATHTTGWLAITRTPRSSSRWQEPDFRGWGQGRLDIRGWPQPQRAQWFGGGGRVGNRRGSPQEDGPSHSAQEAPGTRGDPSKTPEHTAREKILNLAKGRQRKTTELGTTLPLPRPLNCPGPPGSTRHPGPWRPGRSCGRVPTPPPPPQQEPLCKPLPGTLCGEGPGNQGNSSRNSK